MNRPNFFIVGAPKSGTTAMNTYLSAHPAVFMAKKELHYFGRDLSMRDQLSEPEYLHFFDEADGRKIVGEASVWYLYSKQAAAEIKSFSSDARILIMLRNPVELVQAVHNQNLLDGNEDVTDFKKAWDLDEVRRAGTRLPHSLDFFHLPAYHDIGLYTQQVARYINLFGAEKVRIILYDDFAKNAAKEVQATFKFLELPELNLERYPVVNPSKRIRLHFLHRGMKNPSARMKSLVRTMIPVKRIRHMMMKALFGLNTRLGRRPAIDEKTKLELKAHFAEEIHALSGLINRDLSAWL